MSWQIAQKAGRFELNLAYVTDKLLPSEISTENFISMLCVNNPSGIDLVPEHFSGAVVVYK